MKKVTLDSSIWVSYYSYQDINHQEALNLINGIFSDGFIINVPDIILIEVLNVLKRRYNLTKNKLEKIKSFLIGHSRIKIIFLDENFLHKDLINVIIKSDLKSSDLQILACAIYTQSDLHTFDQKLKSAFKNYIYEK